GTLRTAAASSTSPKFRKPNSPYCMMESRGGAGVEPRHRFRAQYAGRSHGTRLRPHASLTWFARPGGASERRALGRDWLELGFGLLIALAVSGATARAQVGFDRAGGDYASFPMRSGDPAQCATRCERDPRCRAWAFSYPVTESANAVCWLKSRVTPR